jgi:hypothetical protein
MSKKYLALKVNSFSEYIILIDKSHYLYYDCYNQNIPLGVIMYHFSSFIGSFINVIILIIVFKYVVKAIRKSRGTTTTIENKDRFDNFLDKVNSSDKAPLEKTQDSGNVVIPPSYQRNIQYGNKPTDKDQLQLKRCKNCGGEIPLTMMKCTICGANQWGCSWVLVAVFIIGLLFAMIAYANNSGISMMHFMHTIIK